MGKPQPTARRCTAAFTIAALGIALALGACADQTKVHEEELTQLMAMLPGRYDNSAQAEADVRNGVHPAHEKVALYIKHVFTPRLGHHVFFAEETAADDPRRVLSERMYGFEIDEKHGIVQTIFEFVEPLRWRDGQQNPDLFTSVVMEDVQGEGCQLLWKKSADGFVATHDPKVCPDPGGAAAPPQATLTPGALTFGDYKFRKSR